VWHAEQPPLHYHKRPALRLHFLFRGGWYVCDDIAEDEIFVKNQCSTQP
jgi:hypothetical protein